MSFIEKIKAKITAKKESRIHKSPITHKPDAEEQGKEEPTFHILPHPAVSSSVHISKEYEMTCAS
jgi:hypothetical protein